MEPVEFRPIPSLPGYQAGSDGSIIGKSGKLLKLQKCPKGYFFFWAAPNGVDKRPSVHGSVCEAFHGLRPLKYEVAHLNGRPGDNRPENLQWKTRKDNHADKRLHGTHREGEKITWAKLTENDVREIRRTTESTPVVGRRYGVSPAAIYHIRSGRNWKHVT